MIKNWSKYLKNKLRKFELNIIAVFMDFILFCKYLSFLKSHRNGSVLSIFIWISVFKRKNHFRNPFLGSRDIEKKTVSFFFGHPVYSFIHSSGDIVSE